MEDLEHLCEVQPWSPLPRHGLPSTIASFHKQMFLFKIAVTEVGMPFEEYWDDDDDRPHLGVVYGETREEEFYKERDVILSWPAECSRQAISSMLSSMGVPLSIQDMMIEKIARCAQEMDRTARGNLKILCMSVKIWVTIPIEDPISYGGQGDAIDDDQNTESPQSSQSLSNDIVQTVELDPQNQITVRTTLDESANEDCNTIVMHMVEVDNAVVEKFPSCRVCLEQFVIGSKAILTPCNHVYHQDCIMNWINTSARVRTSDGCHRLTCPMCRASLVCECYK